MSAEDAFILFIVVLGAVIAFLVDGDDNDD
jgi:hypothetical protein